MDVGAIIGGGRQYRPGYYGLGRDDDGIGNCSFRRWRPGFFPGRGGAAREQQQQRGAKDQFRRFEHAPIVRNGRGDSSGFRRFSIFPRGSGAPGCFPGLFAGKLCGIMG